MTGPESAGPAELTGSAGLAEPAGLTGSAGLAEPAGLGWEVSVNYRKYDGSLHWHTTLHHLGEDEHGVWLGSPPGGRWRRADGPWVPVERDRLLVVPRERWWTARFINDPHYHTSIYADVTMPAVWLSPAELTIVDLDLDVVEATRTREISLLDEDEFAEHQVRYRYPAAVIDGAWASAKWLIAAMTAGDEPFGETPARYRAKLQLDVEA